MRFFRDSEAARASRSLSPIAAATAGPTASRSPVGASGTKKTPSGKRPTARRRLQGEPRLARPAGARQRETRHRRSTEAARSSATLVAAEERPCLRREGSKAGCRGRSGRRNSAGWPSMTSWWRRIGGEEILRRWGRGPRSSSPAAGPSRRCVGRSRTRTWPPCAAAMIRAPGGRRADVAVPTATGSPVWTPIRTRSGSVRQRPSCASLRGRPHPPARANATKKRLPACRPRSPRVRANADRRSAVRGERIGERGPSSWSSRSIPRCR